MASATVVTTTNTNCSHPHADNTRFFRLSRISIWRPDSNVKFPIVSCMGVGGVIVTPTPPKTLHNLSETAAEFTCPFDKCAKKLAATRVVAWRESCTIFGNFAKSAFSHRENSKNFKQVA